MKYQTLIVIAAVAIAVLIFSRFGTQVTQASINSPAPGAGVPLPPYAIYG